MLERVKGFNFSHFMGQYSAELTRSMTFLAEDERTVFLGQAVSAPGTAMYGTLEGVDINKRIEFPVAEEFQMGVSTGLALTGLVPVSVFPRWNFLLLAVNQLINHLDKMEIMIGSPMPGHVIIRTSVGSERPLHPQYQHVGDFSDAIRMMCSSIEIIRLTESNEIFEAYKHALLREDGISTILVEYGDYHSEK